MKLTVVCSRCGDQFSNCNTDDTINLLFEDQKKRHVEGRHTKHKVISERDGLPVYNHGIGNLDIGPVKWITVW